MRLPTSGSTSTICHGSPLAAFEANPTRAHELKKLNHRFNMSAFVDLRGQFEVADARLLCPSGSLDLIHIDFDCSMPSALWESIFQACRPEYWIMSNSGMECMCATPGELCDHWHPVEDFVHKNGVLPFVPHLLCEFGALPFNGALHLPLQAEGRHLRAATKHSP